MKYVLISCYLQTYGAHYCKRWAKLKIAEDDKWRQTIQKKHKTFLWLIAVYLCNVLSGPDKWLNVKRGRKRTKEDPSTQIRKTVEDESDSCTEAI